MANKAGFNNLTELPGKYANTILMLQEQAGYSFLIETIDKNLYELTICVYDHEETMNRCEYVLTCNKKSLRDLKNCLDTIMVSR